MEPRFLDKGETPRSISAEMIFSIVKSIIDAGKEQEFLEACKENNAVLIASPEVVNFTKTYLFQEGIYKTSLAARNAVKSERCDPAS